MAWRVELSAGARKALKQLDAQAVHRILVFLNDRVAKTSDPRKAGKPLKGSDLGHFWRYRVGDYRIIADICDTTMTVLVVRIGHRREIYRR